MKTPAAWRPPARRWRAAPLMAVVLVLHAVAWRLLAVSGKAADTRPAALRLVVVPVTVTPEPPKAPAAAASTLGGARVVRRRPPAAAPLAVEPASAAAAVSAPEAAVAAPALPASAADEADEAAPLDLDGARRRAVGESARGQTGVVTARREDPVTPKSDPDDTPLGREIAAATRPDCKDAYSNLGPIFALPLLLRDAVTDRGCRWR